MKKTLFAPAVLACLMATSSQAATITMVCDLRGAQETPPVATPASGCGRFIIDTVADTITFRIAYGGLASAETAAHIHVSAGPGVAGAVVVPLPAGNPKVGTVVYPAALEADLLAGRMYVNIHTMGNPGGEIRGQINHFAATLDPMQENPAIVGLGSRGWGTFNINTCTNVLSYYIMVESLASAEAAAHIHGFSLQGTNSGVLFPLPAGMIKTGSWTYPESAERAILSGMTYVNVHTVGNPGGEIRGQIVNAVLPMDGIQEVPPVPTPAIGCTQCSFDQPANTMGFYVLFGGLTAAETAAHIHGFSPPGVNSGVQFPLALGSPKKGTWPYGAANATSVMGGMTYVNVHSAAFPGGEIRGQLFPAAPKCIGDTNCDLTTDVNDLLNVINAWGPCAVPALCPSDTNYDGTTDVNDLLNVINVWGPCP